MSRQTVKTAISTALLGIISYLMIDTPSPNKAYAYTPANLVSCSIQVSPQYGTYYRGIYRTMDGSRFALAFRSYCPSMIDADDYFVR
ncbi:MAG: hypothetical protein ACK5EU_16745 [Pseudanabaena sp.]|jgi:hypothetical protein|uniref:hypothetical protein n=1 Tax=Pseudanabaena mucicola TaxID=71190 RepID=UPI002577FB26|nr:hypothetical protein [Pseudanabaena mucicola]MCA6575784.1 hypothetical protein [Pseudanabaena sp. M53BS1SP1A06MG]MCA6582959.1 hypothetical protein [Pseudanabaena sp. M34BS1SP1A06MG]MCA6590987.1 hypothetical protein [Pseudanabaena sp. M38BS1SP1A06MG]MCA6600191.1 hypothetical protein [Pseudanabaena sp. M57BS1SP1A06MG]MCA6604669.1 hypothetical protein [Pseudanabaena sp. M007S1SP1A06QC]MCA6620990.1 hypothetical protein [Pseudanabaena sp. M165S2SP1A06QC]MCE2977129.1 hypothetical protein [Pseud